MNLKRLFQIMSIFFLMVQPLRAQNDTFKVYGSVTDAANGDPLTGASVIIKGTGTGVITDLDGLFSIDLDAPAILQVSFIGFKTYEYPVDKGCRLDISLEADQDFLDEVVVIGYGSVRRKDLTGSVSQISANQIQKASASNILQTLEGRIPGLSITPDSGSPGAGMDILIRGTQSINGSNAPIYVIDGTISDGLNISPEDIESVSVLKDASTVAIYGARAANGVIVVTTKRGAAGMKPAISFKTEHSMLQEGNLRLKYLNADQWVELAGEAYTNAGKDIPWSDADLKQLEGNDVCWPDFVKQSGYLTTNNISVRGGNDASKYFVSLSQTYNRGIIKGQEYKRVGLRLNGDHKIAKWLTFGHSVNLFSSEKNTHKDFDGRDLYNASFRYSPLNAAYDENGEYATIYNTALQSKTPNPMWCYDNSNDDIRYKGAEGNIYLSVDIVKGLKFTARASAKWENSYQTKMLGSVSPKYGFEGSSVNKLTKRSTETLHWITDYVLDYNKQFKGGHNLSAMLGYSAEKQTYEYLQGERGNTPNNNIQYLDAGDPSTSNNKNGTEEWGFLSQFGRFSYSYADRYYVTATVRRDGTSRLANNKYGIFPSVSAAWRIAEEDFMKSAEWLNELKLRASWGEVGNVLSISPYGTSVFLSQKNAVLNQAVTGGYTSADAVNQDLKWESTSKKDIGVDMAVLENKLYFAADFYVEDTKNLLFKQPIALSVGLSGEPYINAGHVRNTGFELETGWRQNFGDWNVDLGVNFSHVNNKVIDLEGRDLTTSGIKEGYPIGCWYGYISDGINRTEEDVNNYPQYEGKTVGDIRFKDIDGFDENGKLTGKPDGKVDTADRTLFGKVFPDFTYGLTAQISYKAFTLQMQFNGVQGLDRYMLEGGYATDMFNGEPNMEADYILDRFHPEKNPDGKYPRVAMGDPGRNQTMSDFWLTDASYLNIRNISLSYSLPKKICSKTGMSDMNIYIGAQNLYTFGNVYSLVKSTVKVPMPRTVTIGLSFTL